jgi:hypothetical protein
LQSGLGAHSAQAGFGAVWALAAAMALTGAALCARVMTTADTREPAPAAIL